MRRIFIFVLVGMLALSILGAHAQEDGSDWENILLLGGDARQMENYDRTDSMIILSINRNEGLVKMTSVMRDTWVHIDGHGNAKINAANVYGGPELAVQTVNESFGTDIEDYVLINMDDLVEIIDLLGGVDVEVSESERRQINSYVESYFKEVKGASNYEGQTVLNETGLVHLNGLLAMSYCRDRYSDSDYSRVMRQQEVLLSMADRAQNLDVDELSKVAGDIYDIINTSMDEEEIKSLATAFMVMEVDQVEQYRIPVDGTFTSGTFSGTWMIKPDFEKNSTLLHEFIYGE